MTTIHIDKATFESYKKHFGVIPDIDATTVKSPYRYSSVRLPTKFSNSGFPGVTKRTEDKFEAALTIDNKRVSLGLFTTPQLANMALQAALRTLKGADCIMKYDKHICELAKVLDYDPKTGHLTWNQPTNRRRVKGKLAGFTSNNNRFIKCEGVNVPYGKVCIFKTTGKIPEYVIHLDGDNTNFKSNNILPAPYDVSYLLRKPDVNASLPKGIVYNKSSGRYIARIQRKNGHVHVGTFDTVEEAVSAREKALMRLISTL